VPAAIFEQRSTADYLDWKTGWAAECPLLRNITF